MSRLHNNFTFRIVLPSMLALLVAAPFAHASKGSIHPPSLVTTAAFGSDAYAVDLAFVGSEPCVLVAGGVVGGRASAQFACGARLDRRFRVALGRTFTDPASFDLAGDHLYVAGADVSGPSSASPILVRSDRDGRTSIEYGGDGAGGAAQLAPLTNQGFSSVMLRGVDAIAGGSAVVIGNSTGRRDRDQALVAFVARVDPTGQLDPSFGATGVARLTVPGFDRVVPQSVRVLDDGRVLVVGHVSNSLKGAFRAFAALLEADGTPVASFSGDGYAVPAVGAGSTSLTSIPSAATGFPVAIAASGNVRGDVKPYVVRLAANGSVAAWGGSSSHRTTTIFGGPTDQLQVMDVEMLPDGSVVGAAEADTNGEFDSFVTRFLPGSGRPDASFSSGGIEPIDTRPGQVDDEWSSAVAVSPAGVPWVAGGSVVNGRSQVHLYRTLGTGTARTAHWSGAGVFMIGAGDRVASCGTAARRSCMVRRGASTKVFATVDGRPTSGSPLLKPFLRIWSKAPGKPWKLTERRVPSVVFRGDVLIETSLRLGGGQHEISVHRNGFTTLGAAWSAPLHVKVG